MRDISLHIMDVLENCLAAGATCIDVAVWGDGERLHVEIRDDGRGMDDGQRQRAADPFFTTKPGKRVGLGLALFAQAARESGGGLDVASARGRGTSVHAVFVRTHPDCKPLGDIAKTLRLVQLAHPQVEIRWRTGGSPGGGES